MAFEYGFSALRAGFKQVNINLPYQSSRQFGRPENRKNKIGIFLQRRNHS